MRSVSISANSNTAQLFMSLPHLLCLSNPFSSIIIAPAFFLCSRLSVHFPNRMFFYRILSNSLQALALLQARISGISAKSWMLHTKEGKFHCLQKILKIWPKNRLVWTALLQNSISAFWSKRSKCSRNSLPRSTKK